jgi:NAD(P)H dehydrogenase (quinone)
LSSTIQLTDTRNAWHRPLPKALGKPARTDIKRVPELVPEDVAKKSGYKLDQAAPIAAVAELPNYDAIIFGSGTRFGVVTSQMRNFLDQTGGLWAKGALVGKVGSVFTDSGTQHGGQESTILSMIPTLLHHGMIVVGLPYSFEGQSRHDEITGCSPYGASTITRPDGSRMPSENELDGARFQGRHVAQIAASSGHRLSARRDFGISLDRTHSLDCQLRHAIRPISREIQTASLRAYMPDTTTQQRIHARIYIR